MRLIDADALMDICSGEGTMITMAYTRRVVNKMPTVDAVPVVRCVECKHNDRCMLQEFVKSNSVIPFNENEFYCPDGERKENAAY